MDSSGGAQQPTLTVYPVTSYTYGQKAPVVEKDPTVIHRLERMKEKFASQGARRSVDAVLLVHQHNHVHILLIQMGASFFKLPGGRLRVGEDEITGLRRKLTKHLSPESKGLQSSWKVGDLLATFYRPNFENLLYPYCPPHITRPKEIKHVYLTLLPEKCYFGVPKNQKLVAVPLFEAHDNVSRYGAVIASLPALLGRFAIALAQPKGGLLPPPGHTGPVLNGPAALSASSGRAPALVAAVPAAQGAAIAGGQAGGHPGAAEITPPGDEVGWNGEHEGEGQDEDGDGGLMLDFEEDDEDEEEDA